MNEEQQVEFNVYAQATELQWQEAPAATITWRSRAAGLIEKAKQPPQAYYLIFVAGLFIGLVVLGWWLWPVEWVDADYQHLSTDRQTAVVEAAADLNAFDNQNGHVARLVYGWGSDGVACDQALAAEDMAERARLVALAWKINGIGCQQEQR
ncbi:MAG: hypothetical protein KDE47_11175 [Caldilineaceae bacterium]|nr:hypothetical protein [Caldilineaceae bacterium]